MLSYLLAGSGFAIGHEISHGLDYQGAQVYAYGTPNPVLADAHPLNNLRINVNAKMFDPRCALASLAVGLSLQPKRAENGTRRCRSRFWMSR